MKILVTGACGFVGYSIAQAIRGAWPDVTLVGLDNLSRRGAEQNIASLEGLGVSFTHGDIRSQADCEALDRVDYVVDAAANPSVLAGADGVSSSRQLLDVNLVGTLNLLEKCRRDHAGFVLLSTSRVYGIEPLTALPLTVRGEAFSLDASADLPEGVGPGGIDESFTTQPPVSLYGSSKLAAEQVALEYHYAFGFPVWINRCGVMAGEGQLGHPGQGIFSFWIHAYLAGRPLKYIGFGGHGYQVRDCLHPHDLAELVMLQIRDGGKDKQRVQNVSGGMASAMSLADLNRWCGEHLGPHAAIEASAEDRPYDLPWVVLDANLAQRQWDWTPRIGPQEVLPRIAEFAHGNPDWLARCGVTLPRRAA